MTNEQHIENLKKLKSFHNGSYGADIDRAIKVLGQEPKTGHWIEGKYRNDDIRYNDSSYKCGRIIDFKENYCPNCGCRMVESQESDKCSKCKYHINPDYTRCKECGAERSDKE